MAFDITSYLMGQKSGGGSGGGDFSIANVTISLRNMSNVKGGSIEFTFPNIQDGKYVSSGEVMNIADNGKLTTKTFAVVLYKGIYDNAGFTPNEINIAGMPEFTGGCVLNQEGRVEITGDGTITIPVVSSGE